MENREKVFSHEELLQAFWPDDALATTRTVDATIARIRRKIGPYAENFVTKGEYGYTFHE